MKRCKTCGIPLWVPYIFTYLTFTRPENKWQDIDDCVKILGVRTMERIVKEVDDELAKYEGDL